MSRAFNCVIALAILFGGYQLSSHTADAAEWKFDSDTAGWQPASQCELTSKDGAMVVVSSGNDPHFTTQVEATAGWKKLQIHYQFPKGKRNGQLFWTTKSKPKTSQEQSVRFEMKGRKKGWAKVDVFFKPTDAVTSLRIDPMNRAGKLRIQKISLTDEAPASPQATPVDRIRIADGFKVDLLYSVPTDQGSWVSLTHDDKGRLITSDQYGKLYRVSLPANGKKLQVENIDVEIGMAQGLLHALDSLYVMVNGKSPADSGLYRVTDSDGDDKFDSVKRLRKIHGNGEHGPHAVILSPDKKSLYVCGGNHTDIPNPETSRAPRVWKEDQLLPRMWDAGGHAVGKLAPGGWIAKTDPDGKKFELIASGFRNEYDIAFNAMGELFTYDADMEWDIGSPWYRPTRVNHVTSGAEFGWRSGTGKWPDYYADSLPAVVDIGPGSPTGIVFGQGARFPAKYQQALFIADWSYGIIYAVHMRPDGSTYTGTKEQFCSAAPLPVTDMIVNPSDGALYFTIGGRRTQSGLYKISYVGSEPNFKLVQGNDLGTRYRGIRKTLEKFHHPNAENAVEQAWKFLGHSDRNIRFAARIAIENRPISEWGQKVLDEEDHQAVLNGLLAICRHGDETMLVPVLEKLQSIQDDHKNDDHRLQALRVLSLAFIRLGEPDDETKRTVADILNQIYPADSAELNRELSMLLIYLNAPDAAAKTVALLKTAPTQEEQIQLALWLRSLKSGWTIESRREYFEWFKSASGHRGGNSFSGFLKNIRDEAVATLTDDEKKQLADALTMEVAPIVEAETREFVKKYTVDDLLPIAESQLALSRRDLKNGARMFRVAACYKCHRFAGQGGIVGPDLTGVGGRFNTQNLVESLVDPAKVISDQYQLSSFLLESGKQVTGRVANLNGDNIMVMENMLEPGKFTNVNRKDVAEIIPSKTSAMPNGLLDTMTKNDILDLLAYLKSGNRRQAEAGR